MKGSKTKVSVTSIVLRFSADGWRDYSQFSVWFDYRRTYSKGLIEAWNGHVDVNAVDELSAWAEFVRRAHAVEWEVV